MPAQPTSAATGDAKNSASTSASAWSDAPLQEPPADAPAAPATSASTATGFNTAYEATTPEAGQVQQPRHDHAGVHERVRAAAQVVEVLDPDVVATPRAAR